MEVLQPGCERSKKRKEGGVPQILQTILFPISVHELNNSNQILENRASLHAPPISLILSLRGDAHPPLPRRKPRAPPLSLRFLSTSQQR
jgi:hypothetical protein